MIEPNSPGGRFRYIVFPSYLKSRPRPINVAVADDLGRAAQKPPSRLPEEAASFLSWLFGQGGLDLNRCRAETLQRRLPACFRALRVRGPVQARLLLEQDPTKLSTAIAAMLVGVTWFFRDIGVFAMLRELALPALLTGPRKKLHVWSAGCSDGAELYSVALMLAEWGHWGDSYLLGTDCRPEAIQRARQGCYEADAIKHVPPELLTRYFTRLASSWELVPTIRDACRWWMADMLRTPEPGLWDLILCRNTAMYLRAEAASFLWEQFETLLRPGGMLVLGKAERPTGAKRLSLYGPCIYRRNRG
jgi:chemotaxis methyl-accepting protein methylase